MRLNIFLLLYFFAAAAIFTFGNADRSQPRHCRHNLANSGPDNLVQPENNDNDEEWSRFIDGEYFVAGRDPVVIWVNMISKEVITMKYEYLGVHSRHRIYLEPFGIKECRQNLELKTIKDQGSQELNLAECGCNGYVKDDDLYIPMKIWTDVDTIKISFEQQSDRRGRVQTLGIYLSEEEAEKWKTLPMCRNKEYMLEQERPNDGDKECGDHCWDANFVSDLLRKSFKGKKPFYVVNGIGYVDLYKRDTVLWVEIKKEKDWSAKPYLIVKLQRDKTLHQDVEIKIEVNGEAPQKEFELLEDGKGLKIYIQHKHCLQAFTNIGLIRYVIRVSEPDVLTVGGFFESDGTNWPILVSTETRAINEGLFAEALSNNDFTTYLLKYIPPTTTISPNQPPPPEPVTNLPPIFPPTSLPATSTPENYHIQPSSAPNIETSASTSKQQLEPSPLPATPATSAPENHPIQPSSNIETSTLKVPVANAGMHVDDPDDCNGSLTTYLLLLIITIIIDVILAIILVLLIIFAYRGSKKMKAAMARKKLKDSKAAAGGSARQGAAAATSPMATTPSKKETKGKKKIEKSAENEMKGKTTGGKKSTDEKTTTYYTADQTKYHTVDQTHYYTVDTTFDKSKKGKK